MNEQSFGFLQIRNDARRVILGGAATLFIKDTNDSHDPNNLLTLSVSVILNVVTGIDPQN